jgi:hypothetical protein
VIVLLVAALILTVVPPVRAQGTRAGVIAEQQAKKAESLAPPRRSRAEEVLLLVRKGLIEEPSAWYPYFDTVYSGGGFTLGAGYRRFTGDRTNVGLQGLYSAKGYKLIELVAMSPGHASGRLDLQASAGWRDAPRVHYNGIGIESPVDSGLGYRMEQAFAGGTVTYRPLRWVRAAAGVNYERYTLDEPTGQLSAPPSLGPSPDYLHTTASAALDWRPAIDYARRGGSIELTHHLYRDTSDEFTFERLDAEAIQHLPILRETWVVSLRARLHSVLDERDEVPYFLLPSLGGGSSLRAYSSWRFRDRHTLLFNGEWRWIVNRLAMDMALFYDIGTVSSTFDGLSKSAFRGNAGLGVRFHGPTHTPIRIELARGREGFQVVFAASAAF